jgi:hypothetical protein
MPLSSVIALSVIIVAFLLFAIVLAWGEVQTRKIARNEAPIRSYKARHEIRSVADEKAATLVDS